MAEFKFTPKEWVLVRDDKQYKWGLAQYSHYDETEPMYKHCLSGRTGAIYCIPYDGNEHLLNTTNDYAEPYEPKDGDFVTFEAYVSKIKFTAICERCTKFTLYYHVGTVGRERDEIHLHNAYSLDSRDVVKPATEEEKQLLLAKLAEIGKKWNPEKKCIEDAWTPKDGDFVTYTYPCGNKYVAIYLCKESDSIDCFYVDFCLKNETEYFVNRTNYKNRFERGYTERRPATEEEKQLLLDALHKEGKDWDESKKEIVEYKWKPVDGEEYHYCKYNDELNEFEVETTKWHALYTDTNRRKANNCFKEFIECSNACDRMNESFKELLKGGKENGIH